MYFEVVECDTVLGKGKYKIDVFNKTKSKHYSYEREMTEGMVFNSEKEANLIASHFAISYNWGNEDAK